MAKIDWDSRIGKRVRLRDLHILFAVAQHGSMGKAGAHLGMTQSAVSQAIGALEHTLEAPLLDRTPRGVELTVYGAAFVQRAQAAFDELRSGIKDIESLADPAIGEVRIACTESIAAGILPSAIDQFAARHPRVQLHVSQTTTSSPNGFAALHERNADVVVTLLPKPFEADLAERLDAEVLFHDRICLAVARDHPWSRRRKINLTELSNLPLISPSADTIGGGAITDAFRAAGISMPPFTVTTFSVHLRNILSMGGRFAAVLPASVLWFGPAGNSLKELPITLPLPELPALVVKLKNRTLRPSVERFVACLRETAALLAPPHATRAGVRAAPNGHGRGG
jgi:DNA-binding transcriptional LysR family regulator